MIIMEQHEIVKNNVTVATLRIYLEGSGDPSTPHTIKSVSVDGYRVGDVPGEEGIDRVVSMEDFVV
jgi:hypothetical protein